MKLIITIDTEEEFVWSKQFNRNNISADNIQKLYLLDEIFQRYNVKPTYLVDYPVAKNRDAVRVLRDYYENGKCEIGSHLHAWVTPPYDEEINTYNSFACNLSFELLEKKMTSLYEAIFEAFNVEPVSFKSGRYGFDGKVAEAAHSLKYKVDTSVTPFISHEQDGGPDFRNADNNAYFFSCDNILREDINGDMLEVPMSIGFTRGDAEFWRRMFYYIEGPLLNHLPIKGLLSRSGIVEKVNISPEGEKTESLISMLDVFIRNRHEFINLNLHSSSLLLGYTPYVNKEDDLNMFLGKIDAVLEHIFSNSDIESLTLSEFHHYKKNKAIS